MVWLKKKKRDDKLDSLEHALPDFNALELPEKQVPRSVSPRDEHSFFADILKNVERQTTDVEKAVSLYRKGFLNQNMVEGMKRYWEEKKNHYIFNFSEMDLRDKLLKKIEGLKMLEREWQELHLAVMQKEEQIRQEEIEMRKILREFKQLCQHHLNRASMSKRFSNVPHEHSLVLQTGEIVRNLHDLYIHLNTMEDVTFRKHVNHFRNDFANWVRNSLQDHELARKLEMANSRKDMIRLLK